MHQFCDVFPAAFCLSAFLPWNRSFHARESPHTCFRFLCHCQLRYVWWRVTCMFFLEWSCCHIVYGCVWYTHSFVCFRLSRGCSERAPVQTCASTRRHVWCHLSAQMWYSVWCFGMWLFRFWVEFVCCIWPDWGWCCRTTPWGGSTFAFWRRVLHLVVFGLGPGNYGTAGTAGAAGTDCFLGHWRVARQEMKRSDSRAPCQWHQQQTQRWSHGIPMPAMPAMPNQNNRNNRKNRSNFKVTIAATIAQALRCTILLTSLFFSVFLAVTPLQ